MQDNDDSLMLLLMLLGCVQIVAGISIVRINHSLISIAEASEGWIKTVGTITKFQIVERVISEYEAEVFCGPIIQYTYNVDGYVFTTEHVSFNYYISENCSTIEAGLYDSRYTVGRQVIVYYDPEQPGLAVLEPGSCITCYPNAILGTLFVINGFSVLKKTVWMS